MAITIIIAFLVCRSIRNGFIKSNERDPLLIGTFCFFIGAAILVVGFVISYGITAKCDTISFKYKLTYEIREGKYSENEYFYFDNYQAKGNEIILFNKNGSVKKRLYNPVNASIETGNFTINTDCEFGSQKDFWLYPIKI